MNLMIYSKSLRKKCLAFALLAVSSVCQVSALTWTESGDAGQELGTAQTTIGAGSLESISGSLYDTADAYGDVDLFQIFIDATSIFSVTVSSVLSEDDDIALWLFDAAGISIYDDSGANEEFEVWDDIGGDPAGLYYLGIGVYGREPLNHHSDPLDGWKKEADPFQTGSYTMSLVGASFAKQVPDGGSTLALLAFGLAGMATLRRRFKR